MTEAVARKSKIRPIPDTLPGDPPQPRVMPPAEERLHKLAEWTQAPLNPPSAAPHTAPEPTPKKNLWDYAGADVWIQLNVRIPERLKVKLRVIDSMNPKRQMGDFATKALEEAADRALREHGFEL